MRIRIATTLVMALLPGCSDPASAPMTVGETATLHNADDGPVFVLVPTDRPGSAESYRTLKIPKGTRGVILADEPAKPPVQPMLRLIRLRIAEGEHKGTEVEVGRWHLR